MFSEYTSVISLVYYTCFAVFVYIFKQSSILTNFMVLLKNYRIAIFNIFFIIMIGLLTRLFVNDIFSLGMSVLGSTFDLKSNSLLPLPSKILMTLRGMHQGDYTYNIPLMPTANFMDGSGTNPSNGNGTNPSNGNGTNLPDIRRECGPPLNVNPADLPPETVHTLRLINGYINLLEASIVHLPRGNSVILNPSTDLQNAMRYIRRDVDHILEGGFRFNPNLYTKDNINIGLGLLTLYRPMIASVTENQM